MPAHTVHFIDASAYIFRAWHAIPAGLKDRRGRPANAVYGFIGFLIRYLGEEAPTHVATAFDLNLNTSFRNELFPDYKAHRPPPPAELEAQLEDCRAAAAALGTAVFSDARYEADDLIATLAGPLTGAGHAAVVTTSDKDLAQLVSPSVTLYDFARSRRYGVDEVREKFGVLPEQVPDLLGLAGDTVDNIPGAAGIGRTTAILLLRHFRNLEAMYADLAGVAALPVRGAAQLAEKLRAGREMAFLSRELATVSLKAPVRASLSDLQWRGPDDDKVGALFDRLGFGSLRSRLPAPRG